MQNIYIFILLIHPADYYTMLILMNPPRQKPLYPITQCLYCPDRRAPEKDTMYTDNATTEQNLSVPEHVWQTYTRATMDAIHKATDCMVTGEVRAINYTVQNVIRSVYGRGTEYYESNDITDYGDAVQFNECDLLFKVHDTDHHLNDDGIELRWYFNGSNVASIQLYISEYAGNGNVFTYLENAQIQWMDGTWRPLMSWYESILERDAGMDITDSESHDMSASFDELNELMKDAPWNQ